MANLRNLKGKTRYNNVFIAEDYTFQERQKIKKYVQDAKEKNEFESDDLFTWRVRGCPRTKLEIKRIRVKEKGNIRRQCN